jgi:hypothetical protein
LSTHSPDPTHAIAVPDGRRFLELLEELPLGETGAWTDPVFVDELDLPKRSATSSPL